MKKISIVTINNPSLKSAQNLSCYLTKYEVKIFAKNRDFKKLDDILPIVWEKSDAVIFIMAIGAVIRKIAPFLKDKTTDPAILVVSLDLLKIIPLLGGHLGGANELALEISSKIKGCIPFITTATDQTKTLSFDTFAKKRGFEIENIDKLSFISNSMINQKEIKTATYKKLFETIENRKYLKLIDFKDIDEKSVLISPFSSSIKPLTLKPPVFLGIGCNRDISLDIMEKSVKEFLKKHSLKFSQIKNIASFEAKKDEKALLKFAQKYDFDIKFFDKKNINLLKYDFTPSKAKEFFAVKGVAEPSAILLSKYHELVIKKEVFYNSVTIAAAI